MNGDPFEPDEGTAFDAPTAMERRLAILRGLFGSWQGDDDHLEEDLRQLYESRRQKRREPS